MKFGFLGIKKGLTENLMRFVISDQETPISILRSIFQTKSIYLPVSFQKFRFFSPTLRQDLISLSCSVSAKHSRFDTLFNFSYQVTFVLFDFEILLLRSKSRSSQKYLMRICKQRFKTSGPISKLRSISQVNSI